MGSAEGKVKEETLLEVEGKYPISGLGDFSDNEQILALHGDQLYDAKARVGIKGEVFLGSWGPSSRVIFMNDEWLGIRRVLKCSKENIERQQALENCDPHKCGKSDCYQLRKRKALPVMKKNSDSERKKKKPDESVEILIDIKLPISLRKQLVRDWEYITRQEKLLNVPCCPTVDQILSNCLDYMLKNNGLLTDSTGEFLEGLRRYFDKALATVLLYENERSQYHETFLNSTPSMVYGAQHLLRLFVKFLELLANVNIDKHTSIQLPESLNDFTRFLKKNRTTLFTSSYHTFKIFQGTPTPSPDIKPKHHQF